MCVRFFLLFAIMCALASGFTTVAIDPSIPRRHSRPVSSLFADSNNSNNPAAELTSTLARLDQQWKIQQKAQPQSRWTKLVLPADDATASSEQAPEISIPAQEDFVYLLEPPNNLLPSCLVVFTGGAGLGSYPQIAYNEFLLRLSNRLNAAIITAPYQVGLDHFALAKKTGELTRRAMIHCQDDTSRLYPANLPTYSLSHSLGSKLSCIYIAATDQEYDGIGYISFNNFSFGKTIGMAKEFAETIRKNTGLDNQVSGVSSEALNSIFSFAEMAVAAVGIDFSPSQSEMDRLITLKYSERQQQKTRLFSFDDDVLENTQDVLNACNGRPTVSGLPGTHLTPVYFKLGLDEIDLPNDAKEIAREAMGSFRSASFGNEEELEVLVTEVCDWIKGKEPSRKPAWLRERPQIAAGTSIDEKNQ
jgi:Protein of unknown function (DUF1350)